MPYCVNCGVELNSDAKRCPLCGVRVVLPPSLRGNSDTSTQPRKRDIAESVFDKGLWIQVTSTLMVIPALLSVVVNVLSGTGLSWSLYVVAALGAVWVWCISPFLFRRNIVPLWIAIDSVALLGLLAVVNALSPRPGWFVPLALPISASLSVLVLMLVVLTKRRVLRELHIVAAVLLSLGLFCLIVEGAVDLYLTQVLRPQWSLIVLTVCAPLAVVAMLLQRRHAVVEDMKMWLRM